MTVAANNIITVFIKEWIAYRFVLTMFSACKIK